MKYIFIALGVLIVAVLLYLILDYMIKKNKMPQTASDAIWKAVYFIQIKQYEHALTLLEEAEKEFALFPEEMSDLCIQRADAYRGLERYTEAVDSYETLFTVLTESERKLKRNDALLAEIKECYQNAERFEAYEKWETLFASLENETDELT